MLLGSLKQISPRGIGDMGITLREALDQQMLLGHGSFGPSSSRSDYEGSRPHGKKRTRKSALGRKGAVKPSCIVEIGETYES